MAIRKPDSALMAIRKETISRLSKEPLLRADHDFNLLKFDLIDPTMYGVQLLIVITEDSLHLDFMVPFGGAAENKDDAYDYCSEIACRIVEVNSDADRFDYNYFEDDVIFNYSLDFSKFDALELVSQIRKVVGSVRNVGPTLTLV